MKDVRTFCLGALLVTAAPSGHAETAEEFLTNVVRMDFDGNADGRLNRVTGAVLDPDLAPGAYLLDDVSLVVVLRWERAQVEQHGEEVCVRLRFEVVARSDGMGMPSREREAARRLIRVTPPQIENVPYCAVQVDSNWKLKDGPLPRVSRLAMLAYLGEEIVDSENRLQRLKNPDPRALLNRTRIRDWYKSQLDAIDSH